MPFTPKHQHYDKAPIREAIIEIQIDRTSAPIESFDSSTMRELGFTEVRKIFRNQVTFEAGRLDARPEPDVHGYQYLDGKEAKHVAQFRPDGFTFSRLNPYVTWEQLRDQAIKAWDLY